MIIIGLTGGIGMGKSAAAKMFRTMGFPVYSADETVHALMKQGGAAVGPVGKAFPETIKRRAIDRKILGRIVFAAPEKLERLEKIIHPIIKKSYREFLKQARANKAKAAVLEIPLLFETESHKSCDITLCVSAPKSVQRSRVMARPHMTGAKFKAIVARQMPDAERQARADYVLPTGKSIPDTRHHLKGLLRELGVLA